MLREQGALDAGDLVLLVAAAAARARTSRARVADALPPRARRRRPGPRATRTRGCVLALRRRAPRADGRGRSRPGDPARPRRGRRRTCATSRPSCPRRATVRLEQSLRAPRSDPRRRAAPSSRRTPDRLDGAGRGAARRATSRFWRCASERAQAQAAAAEIERLIRAGADPGRDRRARALGAQSRARRSPPRSRSAPSPTGSPAPRRFFERAEVKDVLAWLRLLVDPGDAGAVVRALVAPAGRAARRSTSRAACRSRAGASSTWSPRSPPRPSRRRSRPRRASGSSASSSSTARSPRSWTRAPDLFVHRLIDRLGLRRQQLFAAQADVVERLVSLAQARRARRAGRAPRAAGDRARVRPLLRRRRRGRAARGGGRRRTSCAPAPSR